MDEIFEVKEYAVQTLPEYRRPLVEKLISASIETNDTLDYIDGVVVDLLDNISPEMLSIHALQGRHD